MVRRGIGVGALTLGATACAHPLDVADLQRQLGADLREQLAVRYVVACPRDVPAGVGKRFRCTATGGDGTVLTLEITQTDEQASVTYDIVEG
jgi:hypothetical protein